MLPRVKLRADASNAIGLGHVVRLIALAKSLSKFSCSFILRNPAKNVVDLILSENFSIEIVEGYDLDDPEIMSQLKEPIAQSDIVVLDGYEFDFNFQKRVKQIHNCKVVQIDDTISNPFAADLVINHIGGIDYNAFQISRNAKVLVGPQYAILRKEFLAKLPKEKESSALSSIFINFGGADPGNFTCKVVSELLQFQNSFQSLNVVIGPLFQFLPQLESLSQQSRKITISHNLDVVSMVSLMRSCDVAICSASTVAYEFACTTGMLFALETAENQSRLYEFLINENLALPYTAFRNFAEHPDLKLQDMIIRSQQKLFDGKSPIRLSEEFMQLFLNGNLILRRATSADVDVYFRWANDAVVRKNSFSSLPISYSDHCSWFYSNLDHPGACLYIFTTIDNTPIASVRFKISSNEAVLSYLLDEQFRGFNLSKVIVANGTATFFQEYQLISKVIAHVKVENVASYKAFQSNNFIEVISESITFKTFYKLRANG